MCVGLWQVPFGGSFHNQVQWCAWMEPGSDKVRLQISCDVVFTKKWVPVKNIINSSSIEVMAHLLLLDPASCRCGFCSAAVL